MSSVGFRRGMGECAIRTYLIKHPHIIEQGLSLNDFLGFSIWFKSTQESLKWSPLRDLLLTEKDELPAEEFLIKLDVWFKLLKKL